MISVLISAGSRVHAAERSNRDMFILPSHRAGENNRRRSGFQALQQRESVMDAARPRGRGGIIKRNHEISACRRREPLFHARPRLEIVGQGNRAEIMSQGSANPRRRRLHGRDSRAHRDVDIPPAGLPFVRSPRKRPPPLRKCRDRRRRPGQLGRHLRPSAKPRRARTNSAPLPL